MKSKEKSQNSRSKKKKKIREVDSYKIQFKTKIKNNKSNHNSKEKDINSKKCTYANSNMSAKTYLQKPTSSIIKEYNNNQSQINSNNAISYSNYAFSEMAQSKKQNNELYDSIKYNNEDYNTLHQSKNENNKLDINDLNNTNNKKLSVNQKNNINLNVNKEKDFQNNNFSKRAAYSMAIDNQKKFGNNSYNISKNDKNNRNIYETSLKRLDDKLKNRLDPNNFKKKKFENFEQINKYGDELEQYINTKMNIEENSQNENDSQRDNNSKISFNKKEHQIINYPPKPENEKQNIINNYCNNNNIHNNHNHNPNGQDIKLNYKYNRNQNLEIENDNINNNIFENNISNTELYNELEEKLQNLYMKIHGNNIEEPPLSEIPECINSNESYQNQMTYPNLKRYRQKSEPSLRVNPFDADFNNNNNIIINSNLLKRKKSEKNMNKNTNNYNNNTINNTNLIVRYPKNENENKNLSELRMLEKNLKNENSSQRMINALLKEENNSEVKKILSELQMTIKKLPRNEDCKEDNSISTLPPNNLFPFDVYKLQKINRKNKFKNNNNNYNPREINNNRKIEKIKAKLNDFQEIMNKKPKSKNMFNAEPKDIKEKFLIRHNSRKNYTNLCPVNNPGKDLLFFLEK